MRSTKQNLSMMVLGETKLLNIQIIVIEEDDGTVQIHSKYGEESQGYRSISHDNNIVLKEI